MLGIAAVVMASGRRWAPILGTVLLALLVVGLLVPAREMIVMEVLTPGMPLGPLFLLLLPTLVIGVAAGVAASVQNYRRTPAERSAPRWLVPALSAIVGMIVGAATLHALAVSPGSTPVSQELLASLPAVVTQNFAFDQQEIRVKAGELAMLRLTNADTMFHSFDVDEFDVHVMMPSGEDAAAIFVPTEPGTYTFYCAPHYDKASGEGMSGTLIVEP